MNRRKSNISPWYRMGLAAVLSAACLVTAIGTSYARYAGDKMTGDVRFTVCGSTDIRLGRLDAEGNFLQEESTWQETDGRLQLAFALSNGTGAEDCAQGNRKVVIRVVGSLGAWAEQSETEPGQAATETQVTDAAQDTTQTIEPSAAQTLNNAAPTETEAADETQASTEPEGETPTETTVPTETEIPTETTPSTETEASVETVLPTENADGGMLIGETQTPEETVKERTMTITVDGVEYTAVATRISRDSELYAAFGDGWEFRFPDEQGNELYWVLEGGKLSCMDVLITILGTDVQASLLQVQIITEEY